MNPQPSKQEMSYLKTYGYVDLTPGKDKKQYASPPPPKEEEGKTRVMLENLKIDK